MRARCASCRPGIGLVAVAVLNVVTTAQAPARPSERVVRALALEVQTASHGDNDELVLAFDDRVRERWGDFETFPITVLRTEALTIELTAPLMAYRQKLTQFLLIKRPLADISWMSSVRVTVTVGLIDAPDIARIIVERDGEEVAPFDVRLRPMSFQNGTGVRASIHAGEVDFPIEAFAPGAAVRVSAFPAAGAPFTIDLSDTQLRTLK